MANNSENAKKNAELFLLHPNYRFTGYLILGLGLLVAAWNKIVDSSLVLGGEAVLQPKPDRFSTIVSIVIITGLLCIAGAREKVEDDLIILMRFKAIRLAFLLAILYVIAVPVISLVADYSMPYLQGTNLVIGMLVIYLLTFYFEKKRSLL